MLSKFKSIQVNIMKYLIICALLQSTTSYAGIETLIKSVMPSGTLSNSSKAALIQDQLGGHLIGGSMVVKTPGIDDITLGHFTPPTCKLGGLPCNAHFDLRMGAFSYISSKEMMESMKQMAQNASVYGGIMLVKTMCPQCENLMTWIESVGRNVSDILNVNCERMMAPITGAMDKFAKSAEAKRQADLYLSGNSKDSAEIVQKAKKDSDSDPVTHNPELKTQLGENFNLVWKALSKTATQTGTTELKELLMSISGTIVIQKGLPPKIYSSLAEQELIEQYMGVSNKSSGQITLYVCNEDKLCLNPTKQQKTFTSSETLHSKLSTLLESMTDKIYKDKDNPDFTEEEKDLIDLSSVPLIPKIEMDLAIFKSSQNISVKSHDFITHLCYDVVTSHLAKLLKKTSDAVEELSYVQISDTGIFEQFANNAREIMRSISRAKSEAYKRYDLISQMKARLRQDESYFQTQFEEYDQDSKLAE